MERQTSFGQTSFQTSSRLVQERMRRENVSAEYRDIVTRVLALCRQLCEIGDAGSTNRPATRRTDGKSSAEG